jgi:stage II sporulation protein D
MLNGQERKKLDWWDHEGVTLAIPGKISRQYAGRISIFCKHGQLEIINELSLDNYLESVIASEMGDFPLEALRAQAILARTKVLKIKDKKKFASYHVTDLTDTQVYKGLFPNRNQAQKAVRNTSALVLTYGKELAEVFYASTCGGKTLTPKMVWGIPDSGYQSVLCEKNMMALCADSPHYKPWEMTINLEKFSLISNVPWIYDLFLQKPQEGKMGLFLLQTPYAIVPLSIENMRINTGRYFKNWALFKSNQVNIARHDKKVQIKGRGLGHGVGMCQYGARKLADMGYNFRQILEFYYPGFSIKPLGRHDDI